MMTELKGKTCLITGASRGIGEAAARHFAAQGANVLLAARSGDAVTRIAAEIEQEGGGRAAAIALDVSRYQDVENAVRRAVDMFGSLDVLVSNAGLIEPIALLAESDPEGWCHTADVNYKGVYFGLRAAIPVMLEQGGGSIVNVSSGAATGVLEGWSHYCSSKAAALSLTRCAHLEYGAKGIRVLGLSPGTVATNMQKEIRASGINRVSTLDWSAHIPPEWVARAMAFLATDPASDKWLGQDFQLKSEEGRAALGLPAT
mgnify:FL=1